MPLIKSNSESAFKKNVGVLMGEIGKSKHVASPQQALAVAYATKRRAGRAMGGLAPAPWFERAEARSLTHTGPIMSAVPGRTDRHPMQVPANSYVLPADHVSALGQGNTQAGMKILGNMFGASGPYGAPLPHMGHGMGLPKPPKPMAMSDRGGARGTHEHGGVDVIVAGGEYVIPPQIVTRLGDGDPKRGHAILDKWVLHTRKKHVKTLRSLPPPAKS